SLFPGNGKLRMFAGRPVYSNVYDKNGNIVIREQRADFMWTYNISAKNWTRERFDLDEAYFMNALAYDANKNVGWVFGDYHFGTEVYLNGTETILMELPAPTSGYSRFLFRSDGDSKPRQLPGNIDDSYPSR